MIARARQPPQQRSDQYSQQTPGLHPANSPVPSPDTEAGSGRRRGLLRLIHALGWTASSRRAQRSARNFCNACTTGLI